MSRGTRSKKPPEPPRPYVDLHLHSYYSDGSDAPAQVVARAKALGIRALSLTDHDTTGGLREAREAAEAAEIHFLNGVELSCRLDDISVHVLGYGFDPEHAPLQELLAWLSDARARRMERILHQLNAHAIEISLADLGAEESGQTLTRMHVARVLRERGMARTVQGAFDHYLNPGAPGWVPSEAASIADGIAAIQGAGGLAFLAHPYLTRRLRQRIDEVVAHSFDGVEAYHTSHSRDAVQRLRILALDRGLLVSGGSDCHGMAKGKPEMGGVKTPLACWQTIMQELERRRGAAPE
jgi:predicted metal-dependent phosphoesterase TrpH